MSLVINNPIAEMPCESCEQARVWAKRVLIAAGVYNLVWGACVIFLPGLSLNLIGMDGQDPHLRMLWSCVGMIVGVYGLGYAIAAFNPVRHWPIVLVGFLGKILGPIGLVYGLMTDQVPLHLIGVIIFNDLIWWVPFALILWMAAKTIFAGPQEGVVNSSVGQLGGFAAAGQSEVLPIQSMDILLDTAITNTGDTLAELSEQGNGAALFFLRHNGCALCHKMLSEIGQYQKQLDEAKLQPVLIHHGQDSVLVSVLDELGLSQHPIHRVNDSGRRLYRAMNVTQGRFLQIFGLKAGVSVLRAWRFGLHGLDGDPFQMPGVVWIQNGKIKWQQKFDHVGQAVNWSKLLK